MSRRGVPSCLLAALLAIGTASNAQDAPPAAEVAVTLKDGGRLLGTIVAEDDATVTLRTAAGLELKLQRFAIASIAPAADSGAGSRPAPTDPNDTRLMFAPTGRPLGKGDGYFSNHYVLFPGFAYGLTRNISVAGGVSTVPGVGLDQQLFYVSTQAGFKLSEKAALAFGGLYAAGTDEDLGAGVLYGVTTLGRPERSLTLGFGMGATREDEALFGPGGEYTGSRRSWRTQPILLVGGSLRVGRRLSLVSESWLFLDQPMARQPFGLALRFFSDRISVDVGMVLVPEVLDEGFPIPWLSFTYCFGPSRRPASGRGPGGLAGLGAGWRRGR